MTLVLKPRGRGNWTPLTVTIEGSRAQALLFQVGATFVLAGHSFRICKVSS